MAGKVAFQKATKKQSKLRMAIDGPSGSGKTFTGLTFACALANGGRVAVIDTERGSASKYADMFDFDVLELDNYHPQQYIDGIQAAEDAGYDVILIDSLSHAWEGEGGVLDLHDQATKRTGGNNSWAAWKDITPIHRNLVDAMLQSKCHVIVTMRSKMEYVQGADDKGKAIIKKVGMAPVQRQGMEYEFDIVADMDTDHNMIVSKSRCFAVADAVVSKPTAAWFQAVKTWLTDGAPALTGWAAWDQSVRNAFWNKCKALGLSKEAVLEEFGVDQMEDYAGTREHASAMLKILEYGYEAGLRLDQVCDALGVVILDDYPHSLEDGKTAINAYIEAAQGQTLPTDATAQGQQALL
jgi:hypothetical protein